MAQDFYLEFPLYRHSTLPPHITLIPPFKVLESSKEKLLSTLFSTVSATPPINIEFDKVDSFRGRNNVVFLSTSEKSTEIISSLAQKISAALSNLNDLHSVIPAKAGIHPIISDKKFTPHLSLAKHVPDREYNSLLFEAKKRFSPVSFVCSNLVLFKDQGQGWKFVSKINF